MGSGKNLFRIKPIPDPGSRGQKGTGSRIRIRNTETSDKENKPDCSEREEEELHPENVPPVGFGISTPDVHFIRHNAPASSKQPLKGLGREKF